MSFRDNVAALWYGIRRPLRLKQAIRVISTWEGRPRYSSMDVRTLAQEGYRKNELIFACISTIADSAAKPTMRIYDKSGKELEDHPLRQLIQRPNPFMGEADLWRATLSYRAIAGNSYWEKVRSGAGRVVELWPLRPDRMTIIPSREKLIGGYEYRVGALVDTLAAEDVVHIKNFDPLDDFYGLSQIAVCARAGDTDNQVTDYTKLFFQNAAVPYGLLKTKQKLTEAEALRIQERWQEKYAGTENWHEVAVLDSDTEYQRLGLTQDEMAFPDLRSIGETRICMVFKVPPVLVGSYIGLMRSTFSNFKEARKFFWEDGLAPIYKQLADAVNAWLVPDFGGNIVAAWDFSEVPALQEDQQAKWERATAALSAGGLRVNDFRRQVGEDPVPEGDVFLWPLAVIPTPSKVVGKGATRLETKALPDFELRGERLHLQLDRIARAWELPFMEAAQGRFSEERKGILALLSRAKRRKQTPALQDFLFSTEQYLRMAGNDWRQAFVPLFQAILTEQAETFAAQFGIAFDVTNPEVMAFIEDYAFTFADGITGVSREGLADLIRRAQEEGWSVPELSKQIEEMYEGWSSVRATMIARTETIRSSNAGAVAAYKAAGITQKQWWAALDDRVCPWCAEMHEKVIEVEKIWWAVGEEMVVMDEEGVEQRLSFTYEDVGYPPLHVSCRCTVLPVVV